MATILIVDDDDALRTLLRRVLARAGYSTLEASNGREALACLGTQTVDLMITDLFMPQQDGLETILALRRMNRALPIIAMSGGGSAAQFEMLRTASLFGAARVLMKPFRAEEVLATINELLPPAPAATRPEAP